MAFPYIIARNDVLGRHLVAARDIKQGEVIMREAPLTVGGQQISIPICFMCAVTIHKSRAFSCDRCHIVPVCGMCSGKLHKDECKFFKKLCESNIGNMQNCTFSFICENPSVIMPIRCLLRKYMDEDSWEAMLKLESHLTERKGKDVYHLLSRNVEEPLKQLKLFDDLEQLPEGNDLVQKICGILDINSFELRQLKTINESNSYLRGLYLRPALMSHDCICNTFISVDDDFAMTVKASVPILKDETISFNYTNCLAGTSERQLHLQEGKYFTCTCARCLDPTELGTGLSSLICPACKLSELVCRKGSWRCIQCEKKYNRHMIQNALLLARDKVQEAVQQPELQEMRKLIASLLRTFHKNHAFLLEVYLVFVSLREYEHESKYLEEKLSICEQLVGVLQIIEPGISRHQGIVLYELHRAKARLAEMRLNSSLISQVTYAQMLKDALEVLKEAIRHLKHEPKATPEGRLAQEALRDMKKLQTFDFTRNLYKQ